MKMKLQATKLQVSSKIGLVYSTKGKNIDNNSDITA